MLVAQTDQDRSVLISCPADAAKRREEEKGRLRKGRQCYDAQLCNSSPLSAFMSAAVQSEAAMVTRFEALLIE